MATTIPARIQIPWKLPLLVIAIALGVSIIIGVVFALSRGGSTDTIASHPAAAQPDNIVQAAEVAPMSAPAAPAPVVSANQDTGSVPIGAIGKIPAPDFVFKDGAELVQSLFVRTDSLKTSQNHQALIGKIVRVSGFQGENNMSGIWSTNDPKKQMAVAEAGTLLSCQPLIFLPQGQHVTVQGLFQYWDGGGYNRIRLNNCIIIR